MFATLKDKLRNVTKTVPLFSGSDKVEVQCEVNLDAGADVLTHFQKEWEIIHNTNEDNAKKAEEAAEKIAIITQRINKDKEDLALMTHLLCNSNLMTTIGTCSQKIETLYETFDNVEQELQRLEDLIENVEFEKMKKQHRFHLEQYKKRKEESMKVFEEQLKAKHEKAVAEVEQKKQKELEERRKVFDEAFKSDLEIFRISGTIPKLDLPKKQPSALLEEIQVDFDEKELDQFFEDSTH